ncbi:unnamed protein product [Xylocopa violacea]|uniref:Uncharacterized protein n=1 Tax=Xylocopa violacea TaxID=135666 RepID=A0ABP1NY23_XYLVO
MVIRHLPRFSVYTQKIEKGPIGHEISTILGKHSSTMFTFGKETASGFSPGPETRPHEMIPEASGSARRKAGTRDDFQDECQEDRRNTKSSVKTSERSFSSGCWTRRSKSCTGLTRGRLGQPRNDLL